MSITADYETITAPEGVQGAMGRLHKLFEKIEEKEAQQPSLAITVTLGGEGSGKVELDKQSVDLLRHFFSLLAAGDPLAIVPMTRQLTTQEAADLLHVSRPYFIRLLDKGEIPYTRTGKHRRIQVSDLLTFKRKFDAKRMQAIDHITQLSQELGSYHSE
ncbi:MAG: helix-turn-helix domain-containing protein [Dehalococcoidia bacterium]|nr:helix-turn-helix domain-containing protein [Dehalococcoidia bacterium]